jgi:hypothetical protein
MTATAATINKDVWELIARGLEIQDGDTVWIECRLDPGEGKCLSELTEPREVNYEVDARLFHRTRFMDEACRTRLNPNALIAFDTPIEHGMTLHISVYNKDGDRLNAIAIIVKDGIQADYV